MSLFENGTAKAVKIPTKRTVNLAKHESHKKDLTTLITGGFLILVVCILVAKFGVIDQFNRLNEAETAYNDAHNQNLELQQQLEPYPEVEQEYRTYSRKWMKTDSSIAVAVDRSDVLNMLETQLMSNGTMRSFLVENNTVIANMSGMNLEEISIMFAELQRQPIVKYATLTIASTEASSDVDVDFSITITLQSEEEAES